jgi:hypothetical protein
VTLTSVTGYERYWRTRDTDQDFTPQRLFESESEDDAWEFFQDLKASGESWRPVPLGHGRYT